MVEDKATEASVEDSQVWLNAHPFLPGLPGVMPPFTFAA